MDIVEQHEDVWSRTKTVHGYAVDEVRSVLQKSIRRGLVEEAILAAFELYISGPETRSFSGGGSRSSPSRTSGPASSKGQC
jgi:hypothetical protein